MCADVSVPSHAMLQGVLLAKLLEKSVPHVITLLADGSCDYAGKMWCAILVAPVVKQLSLKDDLKLFAQVNGACAAEHALKSMSSGTAAIQMIAGLSSVLWLNMI